MVWILIVPGAGQLPIRCLETLEPPATGWTPRMRTILRKQRKEADE